MLKKDDISNRIKILHIKQILT